MSVTTAIKFPIEISFRTHIPDLFRLIECVLDTLVTWNQRHKSRKRLAATDLKTLSDFGINPAAAFVQTTNPFWED